MLEGCRQKEDQEWANERFLAISGSILSPTISKDIVNTWIKNGRFQAISWPWILACFWTIYVERAYKKVFKNAGMGLAGWLAGWLVWLVKSLITFNEVGNWGVYQREKMFSKIDKGWKIEQMFSFYDNWAVYNIWANECKMFFFCWKWGEQVGVLKNEVLKKLLMFMFLFTTILICNISFEV